MNTGCPLDQKEVIHIEVLKCDGQTQSQLGKFSVDPQVTSFDMLQDILARAFEIKSDFSISYLSRDSRNVYLAMMSDWDMDAAFQTSAEPSLKLRVEVPSSEEFKDWEVIAPGEIPKKQTANLVNTNSKLSSLTSAIVHNLEKTVDSVQKAVGLKRSLEDDVKAIKVHMTEIEFRNFLDESGVMIKLDDFRLSVFQGGIEPDFRRVAWRHLLNIFPCHMSSRDRRDYLKRKEQEYHMLKDEWLSEIHDENIEEEVANIVCMVRKDVMRTDRTLSFYAGSDDNKNTVALLHLLVTFALTHPDVSYCQGMSDLASPILFVEKNEAHAYICFCALMERLRENFTADGYAIMTKFHQLSELINMYDPVLYSHLLQSSSGDMFFCYRWILLELKREFPFHDTLLVLEVMWATLPPHVSKYELALVDPICTTDLLMTSPYSPHATFWQSLFSKLLAMGLVGSIPESTGSIDQITQSDCEDRLQTKSFPYCDSMRAESSAVSHLKKSLCLMKDRCLKQERTNALNNSDIKYNISSINCTGEKVDNYVSVEKLDNYVSYEKMDNCVSVEKVDKYVSDEKPDNYVGDGISERNRNEVLDVNLNELMVSSSHYSSCIKKSDHWAADEDPFNTHDLSCKSLLDRKCRSVNSFSSLPSENSSKHVQFTLSAKSDIPTDISICEPVEFTNSALSLNSTELELDNNSTLNSKPKSLSLFSNNFENNQNLNFKQFVNFGEGDHAAPDRILATPAEPASNFSKHLLVNKIQFSEEENRGLSKNWSGSNISDCQEATEELGNLDNSGSYPSDSITPSDLMTPSPRKLPAPQELGAGNPFLMFMCLALLQQHRDVILCSELTYEETAMYFDRLVRKHDAKLTLHTARQMYTDYIQEQLINIEDVL